MKLLFENWREYLKEEEANFDGFFQDIQYKTPETIYDFEEGCQVKLILVKGESGVEINLIEVLSDKCMRKGHSSKVMDKIVKSADKHNITLFLQATPLDKKMSEENLLSWYQKYGFEPEDEEYSRFELIRYPNV